MAATTTASSPSDTTDADNNTMFLAEETSQHPLQLIYDTLSSIHDISASSLRPLESLPILRVMDLMRHVQLQHLGIPSSAVGRLRHGISIKVAERVDMFDIAAFVLPRGFTIHLHDHPSMTVCSKLLLGEVQIRSFSRKKRRDSDPPTPSESGREFKACEERIECDLCVDLLKTAEDHPWFLTPDDGNYHEITPITDCVLLDILLPPYDDDDRNCTFYEARFQEEDGWQLSPLPLDVLQQRRKFPLPVQYKGFRPQPT